MTALHTCPHCGTVTPGFVEHQKVWARQTLDVFFEIDGTQSHKINYGDPSGYDWGLTKPDYESADHQFWAWGCCDRKLTTEERIALQTALGYDDPTHAEAYDEDEAMQ